ncbi:TonB-dependent receptor [Bacteroides cellulosilyticus]|uniref:TonB-dependent receptor n=1 Tax=Bacteroides cellulosilyticus TaxID=246787 RepID=UPI0018A1089F|nr:TonB-dependent receptor [Bacteroides cellulosilyticus]
MKHKILLVLFLSFMACFTVNAQKVTLQFRQVKLAKVFEAITQQTGLTVAYSRPIVNPDRVVSIEANKEELSDVLTQLLKGMNVAFEIGETKIYLKEKTVSETPQKGERLITISGIIVDEKGEMIIGASIAVQGTTLGTITNADGEYSLANVPENSQITISFIGYQSISLPANAKALGKIVMKEDNELLDEVVVVGYGTQSKARVTGSIASLKKEQIKDMPVTSFEQAIAGQMPGVQVMQQSGTPGSGSSIKVRGASSITAGTNPLIVIDGFPMTTSNTATLLNPEDIESIEVLKDASSAAIYGSRGANGVIVVTTKKGKEGKTNINAKAYFGVQKVSHKIEMMDAYEYANFMTTARNNYWVDLNPGVNKPTDDNNTRVKKARIPDYIVPYLNGETGLINTDWQDEIFQTAAMQQYDISVSGGNQKLSHYTSASFVSQDGIIKNSGFQRFSARSNIQAVINKRVTFDLSLAPSYSKTRQISEKNHKQDGLVLLTTIANPAARAYDEDGSIMYGNQIELGNAWGTSVIESPLAIAKSIKDNLHQFRMIGNANISVNILEGLNFKTHFGMEYSNQREDYFRPSYLGNYNTQAPTQATGKYWNAQTTNWVNENTLNYKKDFGKHHFDVLLGLSAQKQNYLVASMEAANYPNDNVTTLNAGIVNTGTTTESVWTLLSYFGRINYFFQNKYLLNFSIRWDGSSRFGKNNKYGCFPAVSLGWRVKEENWLKNVDMLSDLKLRVSYGKTGNFQINDYGSYSLLQANNYILNGVLVNGLAPATSPNPNISWEKTDQWNTGFDIAFFSNQLSFSADFYHSVTDGLLLDVPVPAASGFTSSLQNIGKLQNRGFELSLKGDFDFSGFKWAPAFNFSLNRNEVKGLGPNQEQIIDGNHITMIGEPIGNFYGYRILGVYKSQEDLDKYPHLNTAKIGTYIYEDISGPNGVPDGEITDADRTILGNYNPDYTIGFFNSFSYKNFDLSFMIQCVQGLEIFNSARSFLLNGEGWGNGAKDLYKNYFSETNPNGKYARPSVATADKLYEKSSYMVEDGSFIRFNNITLGYNFSKTFIAKMGLKGLRVYVTAQNPFTITKYSGYNPEVSTNSNALTPGIDYGAYPTNKSIAFGLNVNF